MWINIILFNSIYNYSECDSIEIEFCSLFLVTFTKFKFYCPNVEDYVLPILYEISKKKY